MDINILKELGASSIAAYAAYLILKAYFEQIIKQNNTFISNLMDTNKALLETNKQISKANQEGLEKVTDELKLMREDINQLKNK